MKLTNRLGLPDAVVASVSNDDYSRGECDMSVTQAIAPPRKVELQRRHEDEIVEDVSERIWMLMGKAIHGILDKAAPRGAALTEERLFLDVLGWKVSGAFDTMALLQQNDDLWKISDYKVTSVWSVIFADTKSDWEAQLNLYAHMLRRHSFPIGALEIVALCRDWQKSKALVDKDYPQSQVAVVPIRLWSDDEAQAYLEQRVLLHQAARDRGELPLCTAEERWERPTKYALMKAGNKRATRVFDNEEEAAAAVKPGFTVEVRVGESLRCKSYCNVLAFCEQARNGTLTLEDDAGGEGG